VELNRNPKRKGKSSHDDNDDTAAGGSVALQRGGWQAKFRQVLRQQLRASGGWESLEEFG